MKKLPKR